MTGHKYAFNTEVDSSPPPSLAKAAAAKIRNREHIRGSRLRILLKDHVKIKNGALIILIANTRPCHSIHRFISHGVVRIRQVKIAISPSRRFKLAKLV